MVSSSLHASCIFKNSNKRRVSLNSLPDDLLLEISSRTAASSLSAVRNLRLVSKTFKRTCDEKYVISRLSLHELTLLSWHQGPEPQRKARSLSNFYKRCRRNGNPEALYLKGVNNYFRRNQKHKGLKLLSQAAKKGNKEAIYIYGLILICGGGRDIYEEGKQDILIVNLSFSFFFFVIIGSMHVVYLCVYLIFSNLSVFEPNKI